MGDIDIKDKIFDFAYELAFRDATMRGAYQVQQETKKTKDNIREIA